MVGRIALITWLVSGQLLTRSDQIRPDHQQYKRKFFLHYLAKEGREEDEAGTAALHFHRKD